MLWNKFHMKQLGSASNEWDLITTRNKMKNMRKIMALNQMIFCLQPNVQDLALVNENEAGDTDLNVHEEVPSALDEILE